MKRNVYIDGENFIHIILACLRDNGIIQSRREFTRFDFDYLIEFVTRPNPGKIQRTRYYGAKLGVVNSNADLARLSQKMVRWNAAWVNVLQRQNIEFIKCGHLKVRDGHMCRHCGQSDQLFMEKGVDVGLAVDIVSDALRGFVDEIVLVSADSDMLPAIKRAHSAGVKIIYAAYSGAINRALTTMVDEVWTYSEAQVIEAFRRAQNV